MTIATRRETRAAAGNAVAYRSPRAARHDRRRPERWLAHAGLLLVCAGFMVPFVWMLSTSLKTLPQTGEDPPRFTPHPFQPDNYRQVFRHPKFDFARYTRNTLIIEILAVSGTVISSAVVAYGFARIRFRGRGALFAVMLSTMMIPFPVTMVAVFGVFRFLGDHTPIQFLGTYKPLWVPAWFGSAFNIFLLRQFFMTLPQELSEAARIDGCNEWGIFWRIVLPLSKPALAVVALFTFMWVWNDFLGPLVYIQRPDQFTLALGLQSFMSQQGGTEWHLLMAAATMVCLPVVVLFFLTQRTFIQGIATTGLKG